jgi:hypothetical protein
VSSHTPVRVFYSYSHRDERFRVELEKSLTMLKRAGAIDDWSDRRIEAGNNIDAEIDRHLEQAQVILLLVSRDFLNSDYCYGKEMARALELNEAGVAKVIPIILRPCEWQHAPIEKLKAIPKDGKPVVEWRPQDRAWLDVSREIRNAVSNLNQSDDATPIPAIRRDDEVAVEPDASRPALDSVPPLLQAGRLPDTEVQQLPTGRPNEVDDGPAMNLIHALVASKARIAYTRQKPYKLYAQSRIIAAEQTPRGQWWIHQWTLADGGYQGWPMEDYWDAISAAGGRLNTHKSALWWPAWGSLSVQDDDGHYHPPMFVLSDYEPSAQGILEYLVRNYEPGAKVSNAVIEQAVNLHGEDFLAALKELNGKNIITTAVELATEDFMEYRYVRLTARTWTAVDKERLGYDIQANKTLIASKLRPAGSIIGEAWMRAKTLQQRTKMPIIQLNVTALLMEEAGELELNRPDRPIDGNPYAFEAASATDKTRELIQPQQN